MRFNIIVSLIAIRETSTGALLMRPVCVREVETSLSSLSCTQPLFSNPPACKIAAHNQLPGLLSDVVRRCPQLKMSYEKVSPRGKFASIS